MYKDPFQSLLETIKKIRKKQREGESRKIDFLGHNFLHNFKLALQ